MAIPPKILMYPEIIAAAAIHNVIVVILALFIRSDDSPCAFLKYSITQKRYEMQAEI